MQKIFISAIVLLFGVILFAPGKVFAGVVESGELIKASGAAVYYYHDGKRYVFPNEDVYYSWYENFDTVKTISDAGLAGVPIGGNVTFRPGTKLVKIVTDPKVYVILKDNKLRWLANEDVAKALYGEEWAKEVRDVSDAFFLNYEMDDALEMEEFMNMMDPLAIARIGNRSYSTILNNFFDAKNTGVIDSFLHPEGIQVIMTGKYGYMASSTMSMDDLVNFFANNSGDWQSRLDFMHDYVSGTARIMNYTKTHADNTFSHRSIIVSRDQESLYSELSFQEINYPKGYLAYPNAATINYAVGDNDLRQVVVTNASFEEVRAWYATVGMETGWGDYAEQKNPLGIYNYYKSHNTALSRTMEHLYMDPEFLLDWENLLILGTEYDKTITY